ncbi:thiamine phosphate synthase [Tolumonas osonensis]|uniref:Thiamine-phosphate synthase n=1 Tax=Tolumonas osonensis TaxID=675874 RepID=A0A841GPL6_9GAMM|nr:thiamine phosphate synthase [Tolumonas osonensis]MBB6056820.1 thiamine-phosphate pyrophosphorylase [Tolumonas osonensis]
MKPDLSLYLVLDPVMCGGFEAAVSLTQRVLDAGVTTIQLRAPQWKKRDWLRLSQQLLPLCRDAGVPYLINDHLDIALACDADGVHLGQSDLPLQVARRLLDPDKILGLSVSNLQHLQSDDCALADYLGIGPVFPTGTKQDADPAIGLVQFCDWMTRIRQPVVAIGGIGHLETADVIRAGADGIAVVSAICAASDPVQATRTLGQLIQEARQ